MTPLSLRNGTSALRRDVPEVDVEGLRAFLKTSTGEGGRVAALFGVPGDGVPADVLRDGVPEDVLRDGVPADVLEVWAVVAMPSDGTLKLVRAPLPARYPAFTADVPAVHLFERELAETWGVVPEGHPWLKPVRFPNGGVGVTDFYRVDGDEVHEVGVGPVHAGVIEPGHFRFQCHGEHVFHLEISLGYQHRGVERALVGGPDKRTIGMIETLSGDSTIAHATAYAHVVEALTGVTAPARAQVLRGVALELERLACHTGDLGALAGDVAYLPTANFCGRIRGDWLNLTAQLCGNRFGRGMVVPGGVRFDVDAARTKAMLDRVDAALRDVVGAGQLLWDTPSVMARFEETGVVAKTSAEEAGLVGMAARACGLSRDARVDFPLDVYRFAQIPMSTWTSGDVFARAWVRWLEVKRSAAFVREQLEALPEGPIREPVPAVVGGGATGSVGGLGGLGGDRVAVALVEGWRGEACHVALTGADGRFQAYKVVDPSFHNWKALELALRDGQISDFPLCNKSFNLSYCGFDL